MGMFYVSACIHIRVYLSLTCLCATIHFFIKHGLFHGGEIVVFPSLRVDSYLSARKFSY